MNAKEYAALSGQIGAIAIRIKPAEGDPVTARLNLAVYHLRQAGKELQNIAEWKAEIEQRKEEAQA